MLIAAMGYGQTRPGGKYTPYWTKTDSGFVRYAYFVSGAGEPAALAGRIILFPWTGDSLAYKKPDGTIIVLGRLGTGGGLAWTDTLAGATNLATQGDLTRLVPDTSRAASIADSLKGKRLYPVSATINKGTNYKLYIGAGDSIYAGQDSLGGFADSTRIAYGLPVTADPTVDSLHARTITTAGKVIIGGDIDYELRHAHVHVDSVSYVPAVAKDVFTTIAPTFTVDETLHVSCAADTMKIQDAGDYYTAISLTLQGANGDDYRIGIFKNGVRKYSFVITTTGANNYQGGSLNFYLEGLVYGDGLSLKITNLTDSDDPTIRSCTWYLRKEHD